jgi:carbon storage regulator
MLVLSRSAEQEIRIGPDIRIRVLRVSGTTVKLGIEAPRQTAIVRGELKALEEADPADVRSAAGCRLG